MRALLIRETKIALRAGAAWISILFMLAVTVCVALGVGPDLVLMARIAPAMLWVAIMLATLLGLDRLFRQDHEDGALDVMLASGKPLMGIILVKCSAHWMATSLPAILATPLLGIMMNMEIDVIGWTVASLVVGTPAISFIGAVGSAAALSLPRGGVLIAVVTLPLSIPTLIFGVAASGGWVSGFLLLGALTLFFGVLGPLFSCWVLGSRGLPLAGDCQGGSAPLTMAKP